MDRNDIWRTAPREGDIWGELLSGLAGLLVVAAAILLLLEIVVGWHLTG